MGFFDSNAESFDGISANEQGAQTSDESKGATLNTSGSGKYVDITTQHFQQDEGAISAATNIGDHSTGNQIVNNIRQTDHDAINDSFMFAGGAFQSAVDASDRSRSDALEFSAGAMADATDSIDAAIASADKTREDSYQLLAGAFVESLGAVESARNDSMEFTAGAFTSSLDAIEAAAQRAQDAHNAALGAVNETNRQAMESLQSNTNSAFSFVGGAFTTAFDELGELTSMTLGALNDSSANAIAQVSAATRSDAADSFNNLVDMSGKAIVAVAAILLVLFLFMRSK